MTKANGQKLIQLAVMLVAAAGAGAAQAADPPNPATIEMPKEALCLNEITLKVASPQLDFLLRQQVAGEQRCALPGGIWVLKGFFKSAIDALSQKGQAQTVSKGQIHVMSGGLCGPRMFETARWPMEAQATIDLFPKLSPHDVEPSVGLLPVGRSDGSIDLASYLSVTYSGSSINVLKPVPAPTQGIYIPSPMPIPPAQDRFAMRIDLPGVNLRPGEDLLIAGFYELFTGTVADAAGFRTVLMVSMDEGKPTK